MFPVVDANSVVTESSGRLCHLMWDYRWLKKGDAKDSPRLGKLSVKSSQSGKVRLVGTDAKNSLVVEDVAASASDRQTKNDFWQLFSIEVLSGRPIDLVVKSQNGRTVERVREKVGFSIASGSEVPEQNDWMPVGIVGRPLVSHDIFLPLQKASLLDISLLLQKKLTPNQKENFYRCS